MEKDLISGAEFTSKEENKLPEGAEVTKKRVSVRVEEIENGFIISKSYDIDYTLDGDSRYMYYTKKWYTENNPIDIDDDIEDELSLADKFE